MDRQSSLHKAASLLEASSLPSQTVITQTRLHLQMHMRHERHNCCVTVDAEAFTPKVRNHKSDPTHAALIAWHLNTI